MIGEQESMPFHRPLLGEEELKEVTAVLESGWLTTGARAVAFEREFGDVVGSAALALSSGTAALHLGLIVAGVGPGDVVVTTPYTFCSTVHVIEQVGARPLFVDVEPDTLNIDVSAVAALIDESGGGVKAVIPVHIAGQPCEMDPMLELAKRHRLAVIEDAAHAFGATYRGRPVGHIEPGLVHTVAFSFYATKNITTGEGGMLCGEAALLEEARRWSLHGISRDAWHRDNGGNAWRYDVLCAGFKYNMPDVLAALGRVQLARSDAMRRRRHEVARAYTAAFAELPELEVPIARPGTRHAWHMYLLRLVLPRLSVTRDEFIAELNAAGIGTSVHFIPIHHLRYYRDRYGFGDTAFPVTDAEFERVLSLPIYPAMTDADVERVVAAVRSVVRRHRR
jgi:dTDP-4-amino-4,6-dideoxygalactose transaminase